MLTAPTRFMDLFEAALTAPASSLGAPQPGTGTSRQTLHCKGETGRQYSGRYHEVIIEDCSAIRLVDVTTSRIVLRDSIVEMERVTVNGDRLALDITNGDLHATACEFSADTAILADGARIDFAGVRLRAGKEILLSRRHTRLIASVSQIDSPQYRGYLHSTIELTGSALRFGKPGITAEKP